MPTLWTLLSESLPALPWDYAVGQPRGLGGDPKVILLVTFVDWGGGGELFLRITDGWTDSGTDRLVGQNSDLDVPKL